MAELRSTVLWQPFDEGSSIGERGSEDGEILRDEELGEDARITLEGGCSNSAFAVTCGIYEWFVHTRFFEKEAEANTAYDVMKAALLPIVQGLPQDDPMDDEPALTRTIDAVHAFVRRFP